MPLFTSRPMPRPIEWPRVVPSPGVPLRNRRDFVKRLAVGRPILVHAILETALGVSNLEEIAAASPRIQGMSFGPADLAASRRMKTTRVGGGHPGYRVIEDPSADDSGAPRASYMQDLWHYSIARMVDACTAVGALPLYGPY